MTDTPSAAQIEADVRRALDEDVGPGDLTASLVPAERRATATVICRESAVICGQPWVDEVLRQVAPAARAQWRVKDGQRCAPGDTIVTIEGTARELLTAERTCLNFLQTLSAVATRTAQYVEVVRGTRAAILDTRKTIPGLRRGSIRGKAIGVAHTARTNEVGIPDRRGEIALEKAAHPFGGRGQVHQRRR